MIPSEYFPQLIKDKQAEADALKAQLNARSIELQRQDPVIQQLITDWNNVKAVVEWATTESTKNLPPKDSPVPSKKYKQKQAK